MVIAAHFCTAVILSGVSRTKFVTVSLFLICNLTNVICTEERNTVVSLLNSRWRQIFRVNNRSIGVHGLTSRCATIFNVMVGAPFNAASMEKSISKKGNRAQGCIWESEISNMERHRRRGYKYMTRIASEILIVHGLGKVGRGLIGERQLLDKVVWWPYFALCLTRVMMHRAFCNSQKQDAVLSHNIYWPADCWTPHRFVTQLNTIDTSSLLFPLWLCSQHWMILVVSQKEIPKAW